MNLDRPLAIDLFCGAGGMSEGIIQAGFHIIYSNEINKDAALTYKNRHKQLGLIQGENTWLDVDDIRNLSGQKILKTISELSVINQEEVEIDAIFGGPPCQGFSRAGKQQTNDIRNTLFQEYLRIVSEIKPKYIVFENVLGINDVKFKNYRSPFDKKLYRSKTALEIIEKELNKIGYKSKKKVLNAVDFGVPQNRQRLIIIGYRRDCEEPNFPVENKAYITLDEALGDLFGSKNISKYQYEAINGRTPSYITNKAVKGEQIFNNEKTTHNKYIKERFELLNTGESILQLKRRILQVGIDLSEYEHLLKYISKKMNKPTLEIIKIFKSKEVTEEDVDILLTKKTSRVKLSLDKPSNTVMTLPDDIISPYENRIFSVRELARLQSFDDSFVFYGKRTTGSHLRKQEVPQYSQVGNAVPPLLAKAIAEEIIAVINKENK